MFLIIGLVVVFGSIVGGYVMHHGQLAVLIQVNELLIIGGSGLGSMIVGNDPGTLKRSLTMTLGLLKPDPFNASAYSTMASANMRVARRDRQVASSSAATFGRRRSWR